MRERPSMRKAIDDFCRGCIFDDSWGAGGNWRQQVEACPSTTCPLHKLRPTSKPRTRADDAQDQERENARNGAPVGPVKAPTATSQSEAVPG